ncbi:hypothetical protein ACS0TY_028222 [Phlomoides rotata]
MLNSRKERNPSKERRVTLKRAKVNPKKMDLLKKENVIPITRLDISGGIVPIRKVTKSHKQLMPLLQKKVMIMLRC